MSRHFLDVVLPDFLLFHLPTGVFITKGDVGVGTIVGSAVFNILVIIGLSGIFAGQVEQTSTSKYKSFLRERAHTSPPSPQTITLTWWSLFRDSSYYILSVLALIMVRFCLPEQGCQVLLPHLILMVLGCVLFFLGYL